MSRFNKAEQAESLKALHDALASCTRDGYGNPIIYTVLRSVSRSGMMRKITPYVVEAGTGHLVSLAWHYERSQGRMADDSTGRWACKVSGAGMDMGFHLADCIGTAAGIKDAYRNVRHEWA